MITLEKGQKIDLTKGNSGLKNLHIGLGWDENQFGGADFDLDASVFLQDINGKCRCDEDFVFYNNLRTLGVEHTGDNLTGDGAGDDEVIYLDLNALPADVHKIAAVVTIHDATARGQNFGQVSNAYIRIVDKDTNQELMKFDLGEDFSVETSVIAGEIYRQGSEWKFAAVGAGHAGGLSYFLTKYGLQ
jgi:tellurium resistance protein TerD